MIQSPSSTEHTIHAKSKKEKSKSKAEPIKLKIKTNARLKESIDSFDQHTDEIDSNRSGRNTRNRAEAQIHQPSDNNIPTPGTANYELYRTLTSSPIDHQQHHSENLQSTNALEHPNNNFTSSEYHNLNSNQNDSIHQTTDFDAQQPHVNNVNVEVSTECGILPKKRRGRNKTKIESNNTETVAVEEPIVQKKQRNRKKNDDIPSEAIDTQQLNVDTQLQSPQIIEEKIPKKRITAAAKKQYKDTEHFPAIEPNPIELQPTQSVSDATDEVNSEVVTSSRGRGRKAKAKATPITTVKTNQLPQNETNSSTQRSTRATRHNTNGNMMQVM